MRVLVVDDDPLARRLLMRALEGLAGEVLEARNGREALDLLEGVDLVLTDLHMPILDGLGLLAEVKRLDPLLPVILVTGDDSRELRKEGVARGADDFLHRPVDLLELRLRVQNHLEKRKLYQRLEDAERTLLALLKTVEARDAYTAGHGERVARYALATARVLGAGEEELEDLRMGALLHDIGKVGIPDEVLRGARPLSPEERRLIEAHPVIGDQVLSPLRRYPRLRPYVRWHHEKKDGSGYPDGLQEIPLLVQAVTAADIFDALTSVRTYRKPLAPEEALEVLEKEVREGRLEGEVVRAFKEAGKLKAWSASSFTAP